jgi:hypothetical protein
MCFASPRGDRWDLDSDNESANSIERRRHNRRLRDRCVSREGKKKRTPNGTHIEGVEIH